MIWILAVTGVVLIVAFLLADERRLKRMKPFWDEFDRRYDLEDDG